MENLLKKYKNTIRRNEIVINKILKGFRITSDEKEAAFSGIKEVLENSSNFMINKWMSGRKHTRTLFVINAFGNSYPEQVLDFSLIVDAQINLLDDLFDENMKKKERKMYILELGRLLSSSSANRYMSNKKIRECLEEYFAKIVTMGVFEHMLREALKSGKFLKRYVKIIYDARSMDIDFFVLLPMFFIDYNKRERECILHAARGFRALSIMKKDIMDYSYDKRTGQESALMVLRKFSEWKDVLNSVLSEYAKQLSAAECCEPAKKFGEIAREELEEIRNAIKEWS